VLSRKRRWSFTGWSFLVAATFFCAISLNSLAASKVKPEIPLGEETFEPTPAPKKAKVEANGDAKSQHAPAANDHSPASDHSNTKDPHAAPPAAHGDSPDAHKSETSKGEETDLPAASNPKETKTNLLEGKVPPATPAKGSGFIWFGAIFVLLAIAIFIFT
jgi:hypothetical protein